MLEVSWSGGDFLDAVGGPCERFPPLRVLFLAHRVGAGGRLLVRNAHGTRELYLKGGRVVALRGFPNLLEALDVRGGADDDLVSLAERAIRGGHTPDKVLEVATDGLAQALGAMAELRAADVRFERMAEEPRLPFPIQEPLPRIISRGLRKVRPPPRLRALYATRLRAPVRVCLPDDSPEHRWSLDPLALRLLREAMRGTTLGELIGAAPMDGGVAVDLLIQLGLVVVDEPPPVGRAPAAAPPPSRPAPAPAPAAPRPVPAPEPVDEQARALREALASMEGAEPAAVLGLAKAADLTDANVERAYRERSVRLHPDRFTGGSAEVRELANRCFSLLSDAAAALRDPAARAEAGARLKAREEGRLYVSEADRRAARLAFARGEALFREKRWPDALPDLEEAARKDPLSWRYNWLRLQAASLAGRSTLAETEAALLPIVEQAPPGAARADVLYSLGELLLRGGREKEARVRFTAALKEHAEHTGAKHRLAMLDRRAEEAAAAKAGLFGGLLNRKK